ncbi:MAG UNVERIFIED_CONTAM: NB-ARC domain-containing protein [Anaerolineae bacterium]
MFWLTVGTEPRLSELWTRLAGYLGHANQSFKDAKEAQDFFEQATHDREILLIFDDLWQSEHAEAFLHLGTKCRLFVSSRDARHPAQEIDAHTHAIGVLSDAEAVALLEACGEGRRELAPHLATAILRACGNLPLALAHDRGDGARQRPEAYWQDTLNDLQEADLEEISERFPEYPHPNLFVALKVSIDQLDATLRERYYDFAIFPDDVPIPEAVPLTFWKPDQPRQVRRKLDTLVDRNLLNRAEDESLSLHDLFLTYLRRAVTDRQARQQRLLDQYRPNGKAWWEVCDPYLWKYLAYHLCEAGQRDTLHGLLFNFDFLQAKLRATDTNALLADTDYLADDRAIRLLPVRLAPERPCARVRMPPSWRIN